MKTSYPKTKKDKETILIVDDQEINREILKSIFFDFNLIEAVNGQDALAILRRYKTDISLVLLDIIMPVLDGVGVLKEISEDDNINGIPVIVASSAEESEYGLKAIELGAVDYIVKPIEPALVKLRVASALQRRENERLRAQNEFLIVQREKEQRYQSTLTHILEHDALTGIYNKTAFCRQVNGLLLQHKNKDFIMMILDVARFKMINDIFGFHEGDKLLKYIALKMTENANELERFCRIEGDSFALFTTYHTGRIEEIISVITKDMKNYDLPFDIEIIVGCYVVTDRNVSVEAMIDRAIIAKRSAKGNFQKSYGIYDDNLRQAIQREQQIETQMQNALKSGQFKMYLQGQYDHSTGALLGAEALVRWLHPDNGLIMPNDFIPIFERNGFIIKLDEYVWEQAAKQIRQWLDRKISKVPLYISVNISRIDTYNEGLFDILCSLVEKYNIPPELLKLEITESAYVTNPKPLIDLVEKLRSYGFVVEIDDFGSGYSSLNTLTNLPVDILKLDMKFLQSITTIDRSKNIIFHVINMAKSLGFDIIAEGVETKFQADFLLSVGCRIMQGYYFSKPVAVSEFENFLCKV